MDSVAGAVLGQGDEAEGIVEGELAHSLVRAGASLLVGEETAVSGDPQPTSSSSEPATFEDSAALLSSDALEQQLRATVFFRKALSEQNPPVQRVIDAGLVPRFIQLLERGRVLCCSWKLRGRLLKFQLVRRTRLEQSSMPCPD